MNTEFRATNGTVFRPGASPMSVEIQSSGGHISVLPINDVLEFAAHIQAIMPDEIERIGAALYQRSLSQRMANGEML